MIKWLQDNPVGVGLASFSAILILMVILLTVVWTLPPSGSGANSDDGGAIAALDLPDLRDAGKIEDYDEIISRPAFNETRQPVIETDEGEEEDGEEEVIEEVDAPDVELAGVIITPTLRMATLKEKGQEHSMVAFVGRPLEGDYGSWQITSIEPREVILTSGDGEEIQLQLQVKTAKLAEPPKAPEVAQVDGKEEKAETPVAVSGDQPLSRAEEIRQRIAERREELKRAAESEEGETEMSYQQAIQSMMGKKRQDNSNNDQDQ